MPCIYIWPLKYAGVPQFPLGVVVVPTEVYRACCTLSAVALYLPILSRFTR